MKKIIRAKEVVDVTRDYVRYANAKDALKASDAESVLFDVYKTDLPEKFKLSVKVRFFRSDGKIVTRRILQTVKSWGFGWVEYDAMGHEFYNRPYIEF